jgi:hypothetical protein
MTLSLTRNPSQTLGIPGCNFQFHKNVVTIVQPNPLPPAPPIQLLQRPQTPQAPQAPQAWVVNEADVPRTGQQVEAMRVRQTDLRRELNDAAERRNSIMGRMRSAPNAALPGLEARLGEVDSRILNIEREISRNASLMNRAPADALLAGTNARPDPAMIANKLANDIVPIVAIISMFVFAPIAFSIARFFWRRGSPPNRVAAPDHATQQKLEHLQQAVDTIAIEIERISEGQRFVTRLLNERTLSAGKERLPVERG